MLGRCAVPLSALLKSKPVIRLRNHPMISVSTGDVIANISIDIRLALPVSELFRLFLERHPGERKHLEELSTKKLLEAANISSRHMMDTVGAAAVGEDESRLFNELEITILSASGLTLGPDNRPPTAYVHFQFLGHKDKVTNPISNTVEPEYNERFIFPTVTNDQHLRLLRRSEIVLSVIDMNAEEVDDDSDGLIGEVRVSLAPLSEGDKIVDAFVLKDRDNNTAGKLKIALRWKHRFRRQRELGPAALSGVEVESLIGAFAAGDIKEGLVDYKAFSRFMDPPQPVLRAMEILRKFCEKQGLSPRSLFTTVFENAVVIDEEHFVKCMLKIEVEILPQEFVNLFRFVDIDQVGEISIDQFLAVLNMDEIAGIPTILQEKLRLRSKELTSRGISTLEVFNKADKWAGDDVVSRMEFQRVLKRLGFQLVDEPDDVVAVDREPRGMFGGAGLKSKSDQRKDPLNETVASGEEELHPVGQEVRDSGRAGELNDNARRDREIFQSKIQDIQQQSRALAEQAIQRAKSNIDVSTVDQSSLKVTPRQPTRPEQPKGQPPAEPAHPPVSTVVGVNLLDTQQVPTGVSAVTQKPYPDEDHSVSVSVNDTGNRSIDMSTANMSASKLQHAFRKYISKKHGSNKGDTSLTAEATNINAQSAQMIGILVAEQAIRESLIALRGAQPIPNFLAGFQTVDTRNTGFVNRKQFAHVMRQFQAIKLTPEHLRACMDYFDISNAGTQIDYNAFCRLCAYRPPESLAAVKQLQQMVLTPQSILIMRSYDTTGNGYIRRSDMLKGFAQLGHGHISQATALSMLTLFETRMEGLVNYGNFVEFVRENPVCQAYDHLSLSLKQIIIGKDGFEEQNLRRWFKKIDKDNRGSFGPQQLVDFLDEFGLNGPEEVLAALYASMDREATGVHLANFVDWLKTDFDPGSVMYQNLTIADLQRKGHAYLLAVANKGDASLEEIAHSYIVYDWQHPTAGIVSRAEFAVATRRAGFVYTSAELRALASEFSMNDGSGRVAWKKFLTWATPDTDPEARQTISDLGAFGAPKRTVGTITRFLEQALQRGVDLLSVFGKYDSKSVGRITASEFCSALSDLGLSSITQVEALEFGTRFKATGGDFILYRRIVYELLRRVDETTGAANIDIIDALRAHMQKKRVEFHRLRDVFEYYDTKRNGKVLEEDLGTIFEEARLVLRKQELEAIADRFSSGGSGYVQYPALLAALELRMKEGPVVNRASQLTDDLSVKIRALFEQLILKGKDFRGEFDRRDDTFSGSILQADFREILQERFRAGLSIKELEKLEKTYRDHNDPRKVNHVKMINDLHPQHQGAGPNAVEVIELVEDLRQMIRKKYDYNAPGELRRPFRHFARRVTTEVSVEDLGLGLRDLGFRVAGDLERALFDVINLDFGRAFHYTDFKVFVCDPLHSDLVWKLRRFIARNRISEQELVDALNDQDSNDSGLITAKQFNKAMKSCNIELSDADIQRLMIRFDTEEAQCFDIERFIRFLRGQPSDMDDGEEEEQDLQASGIGWTSDREKKGSKTVRRSQEGAESRAWAILKRRIEDRLETGFTAGEVFSLFDPSGAGILDLAALLAGSRELGVTMTRAEARNVMRRMSELCGGAIDRLSFFESFGIDAGSVKRQARKKGKKKDDLDDDFEEDSDEPLNESVSRGRKRDPLDLSDTEVNQNVGRANKNARIALKRLRWEVTILF